MSNVRDLPVVCRRAGRGFAALLTSLALGFGYLSVTALPARAADTFTIPDTELAACVNAALGGHVGNTYAVDALWGLTSLACDNTGVASVSGLENAASLTTLSLKGNQLHSVKGLEFLPLTTLDVSANHIADLSPLQGSSGLASLEANGQTITWALPINVPTAAPLKTRGAGTPALSSTAPELTINIFEVTGTALGDFNFSFADGGYPVTFSGTVTVTVSDSLISIPDAGFAACLAGALGTIGTTFSESALNGLASLTCSNRGITDLSGAEHLTGATALDFSGNSIGAGDGLAPLAGLTGLQSLALSDTGMTSVSALTGFTALTSLAIANNSIADISGLGALTNLATVDATGQTLTKQVEANTASNLGILDKTGATPIFDLPSGVTITGGEVTAEPGVFTSIAFQDAGDPISFSGTLRLESHIAVTIVDSVFASCVASALNIDNTTRTFSNIDLDTISSLYCSSTTVHSIEGVQYMTGLAALEVPNNQVDDLSPLRNHPVLASLDVSQNHITDLSPLSTIPTLQLLDVSHNLIGNLDGISGATGMKWLTAENDSLSNIDVVASFPGLLSLDVAHNDLTDLSAISSLASLQRVYASDNMINDVSGLTSANARLSMLDVANNRLTGLNGVQNLKRIQTLDISGNRISDLSPLATRTSLNILRASSNSISSLNALSGLPLLIAVEVGDNNISDVSPLSGKFMLSTVEIDHNHVADLSPLSSVAAVDGRDQSVTMSVVPQVGTDVPLLDVTSAAPTLSLPSGITLDQGKLTAAAEGTYQIPFTSGDYIGTRVGFTGTLTVESAYHTFTAPVPTISGTVKVDATLTADPGTWDPEPESLAYQWKSNGVDISGANQSSYVVKVADLGSQLTVAVTGTSAGFADKTVTSAPTSAVGSSTFTAPGDVSVAGTFAVGNTVSVDPGTWTPTPGGFSYQWLRDGVAIQNATTNSYLLTADDQGKVVSVEVTATRDGYADESVRSAGTTVALGTMTGDKPIIVGTPALGQTLQVGTGFWSPSPSFSLQWYRAGYPIAGATDYTYVVTTDDVGKAITVSQTGTVAGYQPLTRLSDPTLTIPEGAFTKPSIVAITGTLAVGNTVTAEPGSAWDPSADSFSYQWFRDGSPVVGSTASSYALSADDQGHLIKVTVTAHKAGYADASVDSVADTVAKGLLDGTKPTISGSGVFGETLQASSPAWSPVANLSWQWLRNGDAITGATGTNYRLGVDDIGATIRVAVTATLDGYNSQTLNSDPVATIAAASFTGSNAITVSGDHAVGSTLSADPVAWTPTPDQVSYTWLREGTPIPGATSTSYALTADDLGKHVTVKVVASRAGYTEVSLTSVEGDAVAASAFSTEAPVISGNAVVGQTLTATSGAWSPMATNLSYQWLADGQNIESAASNSVVLTPTMQGKKISVEVTGTRDGYATKKITSAQTSAVAAALLSGPSAVAVSGTFTVGESLTADAGTWTPNPGGIAYQWLRAGQPISGAVSADYLLTSDDANKIVTVQATITKDGYREETIRSIAADPVAPASFTAATPVITGDAALGNTLSVTKGSWSPEPSSSSIQWLRNGAAIDGANGSDYVLTAADVGKAISVAVSGSAPGYADHTATSVATDPVAAGTFTAPSAVTVTGERVVGQTLVVDPGTWTPTPAGFTYQWLRDGTPIDNADADEYTLVADDLDAVITVIVTANRPGYTDAHLESATAAAVGKGTIVTEKPTIAGQAQVGRTLTAKPGAWSPMPSSWTYQWLRDGEEIPNETNASYVATQSDSGANITVAVSGGRDGYETTAAVVSDPLEVSPQGTIVAPDAIEVDGDYVIGATLTARAADWTPTPGAVSYQWLRSGTAIPEATEATYKLVAADLNKVITVKVTATKDGYRSASARSQATAAVAAAVFSAPTPIISGSIRLGAVLTANPGTWSVTPNLTYQWYRAGVAVRGATRASYAIGAPDVGKRLIVKVTGTLDGYATAVRTSAATATVPAGTLSGPRPKVSGKAKVKSTLKVVIGRWSPSGIKIAYKWYRNGSPIKGAKKGKYKLTSKDRGKRIGVRVTYTKSGYVTKIRWVKATKPVK